MNVEYYPTSDITFYLIHYVCDMTKFCALTCRPAEYCSIVSNTRINLLNLIFVFPSIIIYGFIRTSLMQIV